MTIATRRKRVLVLLAAGGLLGLATACDPIREPWVRSPNQLAQERARPFEAQVALQHRLRAVQTDR